MATPTYSIIIPIFNEENRIEPVYNAMKEKLNLTEDYEVIFVNDGSTDYSYKILKQLAENESTVKLVNLNKNYGKENAILAGLNYASGRAVIIMTVSSGTPFDAVKLVINKWLTGSKIVHAYKKKKKGSGWLLFKYNFMKRLVKFFGFKYMLLPKPSIELYDRRIVDVLIEEEDKQTRMRNSFYFKNEKFTSIQFEERTPSKRGIKMWEDKKNENNRKREIAKENIKKAIKAKPYFPSFLTGSILFFVSMVSLLLGLLGQNLNFLNMYGFIALYFATFVCLITSAIFTARGAIIRRLGKIFGQKENEKLFEVNEIYGALKLQNKPTKFDKEM
jgi:dolichol-phosphate mannosyltransferase